MLHYIVELLLNLYLGLVLGGEFCECIGLIGTFHNSFDSVYPSLYLLKKTWSDLLMYFYI